MCRWRCPFKKIKVVCEAIDYLNTHENSNLKLIVIGAVGKDTNKIKSYPFVQYIEKVAKKIWNLIIESQIYIFKIVNLKRLALQQWKP